MGLRDIERKIRADSAFQRKEAEVLLQQLDQMIENVEALKRQLTKFEKENGKEIVSNKDYYLKISELRENLGLPKEIGIYEWKEKPKLGGKKEFLAQLGNEILELGKSTLTETGGLLSVAEIVLRINKMRPGRLIPPEEVIEALERLSKVSLIEPIKKLSSGVLVVQFVSIELTRDQETVFDLASRQGFLTTEKLVMQLGWSAERAVTILEELVNTGVALKDESYQEGTNYWFPSLGQ